MAVVCPPDEGVLDSEACSVVDISSPPPSSCLEMTLLPKNRKYLPVASQSIELDQSFA